MNRDKYYNPTFAHETKQTKFDTREQLKTVVWKDVTVLKSSGSRYLFVKGQSDGEVGSVLETEEISSLHVIPVAS